MRPSGLSCDEPAGTSANVRCDREAPCAPVPGLFDPTSSAAIPTRAMWIGERLRDLRYHLADTIGPALELSALRHRPWWR